MKISINTRAYKTLINVLLSCRCPISKETEKDLIDYYKSKVSSNILNYSDVIKIANGEKKETVFHRLKEFCIYSIDDLGREYIISEEDVIRHFSSAFHWHLLERGLIDSYKNVINIPSWFIGHMLMPVKLQKKSIPVKAQYQYGKRFIIFSNVFLSKDIIFNLDSYYCIHYASIISEISSKQFIMISKQLEEIDLFKTFRKDIREIDYLKFQRFGDYYKICQDRYGTYFS